MKNRFLSRFGWILAVIGIFLVVYQFSGVYAYVEGDDASSIAYHVLGRSKAFQPPYSAYHGMMDHLLSILPAREDVLRTAALGITRFANVVLVILILVLIFDWLRVRGRALSGTARIMISLALLLAVPELFYFGLVYSPTLVAMALAAAAHLILRFFYLDAEKPKKSRDIALGVSVLVFGLAVSFRWNIITYGLVIFADLLISQPAAAKSLRERWKAPVGWGLLALAASLLMILLSGLSLSDLLSGANSAVYVLNQSGTISGGMSSLKEAVMDAVLVSSSLLTPMFLLLAAVGVIKTLVERSRAGWLFLAGILAVLPWIKTGVPKFLIASFPVLMLAFAVGLEFAWSLLTKKFPKTLVASVMALGLLLPWVIGVQVDREGLAWGPGFNLKTFDYAEREGTDFNLALAGGMAYPTPEGPRPLYGHAYVLLGGEWQRYIAQIAAERSNAVQAALENQLPIVVTSWSPDYFLDDLYAQGFTTADPYNNQSADGYFIQRTFTDSKGRSVTVLYHEADGEEAARQFFSYLEKSNLAGKVVFVGYSKTLHILYQNQPQTLNALGRLSAVLDVGVLQASAKASGAK